MAQEVCTVRTSGGDMEGGQGESNKGTREQTDGWWSGGVRTCTEQNSVEPVKGGECV